MSKPTHTPTPGPWELRENAPYDTGGWVVFSGRGEENKTICRLPYGNIVPCPDTPERRENTANAQLITVAPDMLEALECQIDYERWDDMMPNISHSEIQKFSAKWELRWREVLEIYPDIFFDRFCLKDLADELRRRAIAKAKGEVE